MIKFISNHRHKFIAILFSIWALYLRVRQLHERELWVDELNQLKNTLGSFQPIWRRLNLGELTCFPGEYILTWPFVQMFPDNKWGMNIPHIIATIIGFYFMYRVCQRHLKTTVAWLIAFAILTLNRNLIYHAFELRPYAVLPTISLAVFYYVDLLVNDYGSLSRTKRIGITIFFILATIYHAYGLPIIVFCYLYFILAKSNLKQLPQTIQTVWPFAWHFAIVCFPLFLWYASGNSWFNYEHTQGRNINTFDFIKNPLDDFWRFWRSVFSNLMGYKQYRFKWLIFAIPITLLLPYKNRIQRIGFFLCLIILPIVLILVSDLHKGYWFVQRQYVWVMPLYAVFIAWCWDGIILFFKNKEYKDVRWPLRKKNSQ